MPAAQVSGQCLTAKQYTRPALWHRRASPIHLAGTGASGGQGGGLGQGLAAAAGGGSSTAGSTEGSPPLCLSALDGHTGNGAAVGVEPCAAAGAGSAGGAGGSGGARQAQLKLKQWAAEARQLWRWKPGPNAALEHVASGRCLDIAEGRLDDGAALQLFECNGTPAQLWNAAAADWVLHKATLAASPAEAGGGLLVNPASGKCVDIDTQAAGGQPRAVLFTCGRAAVGQRHGQRWAWGGVMDGPNTSTQKAPV